MGACMDFSIVHIYLCDINNECPSVKGALRSKACGLAFQISDMLWSQMHQGWHEVEDLCEWHKGES